MKICKTKEQCGVIFSPKCAHICVFSHRTYTFFFSCFPLFVLLLLLLFLRAGIKRLCVCVWLGLKPAFILLSQTALPKVHFNHHLEQPKPFVAPGSMLCST